MTTSIAYCTILTSNYLPKALSLAESLRRHHDGAVLKILLVDVADDAQLPVLEGVECLSSAALGLSKREILDLATSYELVEFATAVKPVFLKRLLEDAEHVVYLDPDTYVTAPMAELLPALHDTQGGILLTPHFLLPPQPDADFTESHMLSVGVFNLGFCAVDRRAAGFLDWWWRHLRTECLYEPLSGLFVDQKWVDIGSTLFRAGSFRHSGYNVGVGNLDERPLAKDADGYYNAANGDRLRLFHFHAFDSRSPETLSLRFQFTRENPLHDGTTVRALCSEYAAVLSSYERSLPAPPPYPYTVDTRGKRISRRIRRVHRERVLAGDAGVPSPFVAAEAAEYESWRRGAYKDVAKGLLGDTAKSVRYLLPDQYNRINNRFPKVAEKLRARFSGGAGMWG